jgi:hypothetical protein
MFGHDPSGKDYSRWVDSCDARTRHSWKISSGQQETLAILLRRALKNDALAVPVTALAQLSAA